MAPQLFLMGHVSTGQAKRRLATPYSPTLSPSTSGAPHSSMSQWSAVTGRERSSSITRATHQQAPPRLAARPTQHKGVIFLPGQLMVLLLILMLRTTQDRGSCTDI
ncbi:hypothetical protein E2C01_086357 [Portunus trituberculatus]|uniref:Uncharacterized protein n=1 Tax=Portunus trituberculatus TaxID=210409 RepID=A0A5B7J3L1_PORTR|nr:hypothetical protein [Portunus trituberculatus]